MIAKEYWNKFYKEHEFDEPSSFAHFVLPMLKGGVIDLGCGDGRDVFFFMRNGIAAYGVDASNEDVFIIKQDVNSFIKENPCPLNVYTRFFWHAIDDETRENILNWVTDFIFIEARTTKDKPKDIYGKHDRNLVDVKKLVQTLIDKGFVIDTCVEGYGLSPLFGEDPHLVRLIAHRT